MTMQGQGVLVNMTCGFSDDDAGLEARNSYFDRINLDNVEKLEQMALAATCGS